METKKHLIELDERLMIRLIDVLNKSNASVHFMRNKLEVGSAKWHDADYYCAVIDELVCEIENQYLNSEEIDDIKLCKTQDEFCEFIDNYPGELYVKGCNAYKVEGKDKVLIATIENGNGSK